jgi:hypothetical protein
VGSQTSRTKIRMTNDEIQNSSQYLGETTEN